MLCEKLRRMALKFTWLVRMEFVWRRTTSCRRGAQDASSRGEEFFWGTKSRIHIGKQLSSRIWGTLQLRSKRQDGQISMGASREVG